MKVVGVTRFGGPDALELFEVPEPRCGTGQVRIRVRAAAVSPTDTLTRVGARWPGEGDTADEPQVPGMDCAGQIVEVSEDLQSELAVGDDVMAVLRPQGSVGAYSEQVCVPAESVVRMPAGASYAEASTLPMNGLTARRALDLLDLTVGETLAVVGAAGAVGGYAIELAKAEGLTVVADASTADRDLVAGFGADHVVARGHDVAERILEVAPGGVTGLLDAALLGELVVPAVRDGGRLATLRGWEAPELPRGVQTTPVWVRDYVRRADKLDDLRVCVEKGALTLRVAGVFPAEQASQAHRLLEAGGARGRFVLEF